MVCTQARQLSASFLLGVSSTPSVGMRTARNPA
eukprot:CAMPEP_0182879966 /NCGR_PEP_ID=MMETSP0034_2-20130328/16291_1 /TAXON_ID=156128 /ORGANISM="Nephroselmis pyriformis, Strain CCMP717" /LENGTH=32 /DNA_ID= /DNA_START= /DNA_END= /DNA_ORIENTATION=